MPEYTYQCPDCRYLVAVQHPPGRPVVTYCPQDGVKLRRKYYAPRVNWNGMKPSQGELSNVMRDHIADAPRKRERYKELKHAAGKD